jgi:hypothetical protein
MERISRRICLNKKGLLGILGDAFPAMNLVSWVANARIAAIEARGNAVERPKCPIRPLRGL